MVGSAGLGFASLPLQPLSFGSHLLCPFFFLFPIKTCMIISGSVLVGNRSPGQVVWKQDEEEQKPSLVKSLTESQHLGPAARLGTGPLPGLSCPGLFLLTGFGLQDAPPDLSLPGPFYPQASRDAFPSAGSLRPSSIISAPLLTPLLTPLPARPPVTVAPGPSLGPRGPLNPVFVWFYRCISVGTPEDTHILKHRRLFVLSIYNFLLSR